METAINKPKISLIIAVYNGEKLIGRAIESILNQNYRNIEVIIIDGDSKDNTLTEIKRYENHISCLVSEPDLGIYDALNKGVSKATGDWVYIMGCDDILYDNRVFLNLTEFLKLPELDIIYGKVAVNYKSEVVFHSMPQRVNKKYLLKTLSIWHQSIIVRRELFNNKKFDLNYQIAADLEWMLELIDQKKCIYVDQTICFYGLDGESSRNKLKLRKEQLKILIKHSKSFFRPYCRYLYWRLREFL